MKRIRVVWSSASILEWVRFRYDNEEALAQNPNLLRTLIGLSLTLIVLLSMRLRSHNFSELLHLRNRSD